MGRLSKQVHCWDQPEHWEEFRRLEEACYHWNSGGKPLAKHWCEKLPNEQNNNNNVLLEKKNKILKQYNYMNDDCVREHHSNVFTGMITSSFASDNIVQNSYLTVTGSFQSS